MGKSGQRKPSELIIRSKRNWLDEGIMIFLSLIGWSYCLLVLFFFISVFFDYNGRYISIIKIAFKITNKDIQIFLFNGFLIWLSFYIGLWVWRFYNRKRFGTLRRRTYPKPVTRANMLELQLMSEENYDLVQRSKLVVFEENPIRDIN
jgi:poly-beta-1,6-N-acetyl-D-glucosamine synthesis protein